MTASKDSVTTFEVLCEWVNDAALVQQRAYEFRQSSSGARSNTSPTTRRPTKRPGNSSNVSTSIGTKGQGKMMTDAERQKHWDNDTCFKCGKAGHFARNCKEENAGPAVKVSQVSQDEDYSGNEEEHQAKNE